MTSAVAIIGGGVVGLSIAFHLAEARTSRVTAYERKGVGAEASGVQPGGVRQQWSTEVNCRMARESAAFFADLGSALGASSPPTLERCGYLFLAHSAERLTELERDVVLQNSVGVPSRLVSPAEAAEIVPGLGLESILGAAFCSEDGYVDRPQAAVEAFAEAAFARGVKLRIGDVVNLRPDGHGWRLELGDGATERADQVVVAAGYDAPALLRTLELNVPIRKEARFLFLSEPIRERLLEPLVISLERHFAAKQLASGRVLASDLSAREDPDENSPVWRENVRGHIEELVPLLSYVPLPLLVEGYYDVTPDAQAIIGPVDGRDGLWLAAGFSGHGFMMAPSVGRRLAATIHTGELDSLLVPFSLQRFDRDELKPERQIV